MTSATLESNAYPSTYFEQCIQCTDENTETLNIVSNNILFNDSKISRKLIHKNASKLYNYFLALKQVVLNIKNQIVVWRYTRIYLLKLVKTCRFLSFCGIMLKLHIETINGFKSQVSSYIFNNSIRSIKVK